MSDSRCSQELCCTSSHSKIISQNSMFHRTLLGVLDTFSTLQIGQIGLTWREHNNCAVSTLSGLEYAHTLVRNGGMQVATATQPCVTVTSWSVTSGCDCKFVHRPCVQLHPCCFERVAQTLPQRYMKQPPWQCSLVSLGTFRSVPAVATLSSELAEKDTEASRIAVRHAGVAALKGFTKPAQFNMITAEEAGKWTIHPAVGALLTKGCHAPHAGDGTA